MRRKEIDILLNALDESANSNSFWITLAINGENASLDEQLIQHLKTGNFHYELVKEDLNRGFNDYTEIIFVKGFDKPTFLQRPGNVWSGMEQLTINSISKERVKDMLFDMLTGSQNIYSKSSSGTQLNRERAADLINTFFLALDEFGIWSAHDIKPNFLNKIDDYYNSNYIKLGYFENCKRDMALVFNYEDEINILLTNGYG